MSRQWMVWECMWSQVLPSLNSNPANLILETSFTAQHYSRCLRWRLSGFWSHRPKSTDPLQTSQVIRKSNLDLIKRFLDPYPDSTSPIFINQDICITQIFSEFGMENCKRAYTQAVNYSTKLTSARTTRNRETLHAITNSSANLFIFSIQDLISSQFSCIWQN